jgi:hypothetical protein
VQQYCLLQGYFHFFFEAVAALLFIIGPETEMLIPLKNRREESSMLITYYSLSLLNELEKTHIAVN